MKKTEPITLHALLAEYGISQNALARASTASASSMSKVVREGVYPASKKAAMQTAMRAFLKEKKVPQAKIDAVIPIEPAAQKGTPKATSKATSAAPTNAKPADYQEPTMIPKCSLDPRAKRLMQLFRDPFADPETREDVFISPDLDYTREVMLDAAKRSAFVAITGESGSGKTTLLEDFHLRIALEGERITVIQPYVLSMEGTNARGNNTLSATQLGQAIVRTLNPAVVPSPNPQALFGQVSQLLKESAQIDQRCVLIIDEAHRLPLDTLRHLKRFLELKMNMRRLLGVILIAQPELRTTLNPANASLREVSQRCEQHTIPPLNEQLEKYLAHKFTRINKNVAEFIAPNAYDAIRKRLSSIPASSSNRGGYSVSLCYPLAVNNFVAKCFNSAAVIGQKQIDAELVMSVI
jgi:type II secretory pathway predicted ATPase ExeA